MRRGKNTLLILSVVLLVSVVFLYVSTAGAGPYLDSAHGNSSYGVKRSATGFPSDYPRGLCAHCHEQHASIGGSEPAPTGGPDNYLLFNPNNVSQTVNVCFNCHTDTGSYQAGGSVLNRCYSFRAGGWTADTIDDILEVFSFNSASPPATSHNLDDISTFITGRWGYTSDSNPCIACHNPHSAQGDPPNAPNSAKSISTRGWLVSRPSQHSRDNNAWGLWGDDPGEKMSDYVGALSYQAPYRYNSTTSFEPDGSTTQDGSNLTDFVSLCTDCHNTTNTIYSTTRGRNLGTIDWVTTGGETGGDKHGKNYATVGIAIDPPFDPINYGQYVLSCTDCHEPHGSPNAYLIRREVNGGVLAGTVGGGYAKSYGYLCRQCHVDDNDYNGGTSNAWEYIHHLSTDSPYVQQPPCGLCHPSGGNPPPPIKCTLCHYHGSSAAGRRAF